ncbi:glycosyl hydrolase 115 family protein [Demequina sp. SYSU T00192]|uniref:Glycosyl hydrolase 115 family protein n=1 Tax=Demequina litoralis TaxID=3051660 RepID=A0ABT8GCJ2_9MICO|nr:glycosyl hydrolase 115 family protein [Demequina sp. SYSU T00192]MDN4476867.1 glycosyl hydrolase 115 family protein [Demequina sp. SYSU T00192]
MSYLVNEGGVLLARRGGKAAIAVDPREDGALLRAVGDLAADLTDVAGAATTVAGGIADARIVVATLGSPLAAEAHAAGVDTSGLLDEDGRPRWEGYVLHAADDRLWIVGTDRRGAIYGVYDLCAAMGVSPWRWFADVPVRTRDEVRVATGTLACEHPSVRYRGIFINDEEALEAWARAHTADGTIGPELYARVFELLLRLRANHIWPAMHVNHFNGDPRNGRLAQDMGIVVGTSHCDMLSRSNENEWRPWVESVGEDVEYDYSIPGRNRELLQDYWRGGIDQNREYEMGWTVGMRGIHDSGFVTSRIDDDPSLSPGARDRAKMDLLGQIIADQRGMLDGALGPNDGTRLSTFVPYKEVLGLYDAGMAIPEDVTIIWADDNFGYIRRFPTDEEAARPGGQGLYYHSSYWSEPPRSYLFIGSTPLAHMKLELGKAWDHGIRTLWIDNIGSLKPLEQDTEFFLRYAWEVGKESTTADVTAFTAGWIDQNFSGSHGSEVAAIYDAWAQEANQRKIEHLHTRSFSHTAYGDEAGRRLATMRDLYDRVNAVMAALPEAERDAFFQLMGMKVHASYLASASFAYADRSLLAYDQGKMRAADRFLEIARTLDGHKRAMIRHYNTVMSDGRWDGILNPENFAPPTTALFPAARPALEIGASTLGVTVWGDDAPVARPRIVLSPDGAPKWLEVFSTGADDVDFSIDGDPWIAVEARGGTVGAERRLTVRVDDAAAAGRTGTLTVTGPGCEVVVDVVAEARADARPGDRVESDGTVSLLADAPSRIASHATSGWGTVPVVGRFGNALTTAVGAATPEAPGAALEFDVHLRTPGAHLLELHRFPTLDSTGRIRLAVSVDDHAPVVVESPTTDEKRGDWYQVVLENVERLELRLPFLEAGPHTLRLHVVDRHVALSKAVIYTAARRGSALGPLPSPGAGTPVPAADPDPLAIDLAGLDVVARDVYRVTPVDIEPHPAVYADSHHWDGNPTFRVPRRIPQPVLGAPRHGAGPDGRKDVRAAIPAGAIGEHRPGVLAIRAERALLGSPDGYVTASLDAPSVAWRHTNAETDGRTGLAMHVDAPFRRWTDPAEAPGMHVRVRVETPGRYRVWMLTKCDSHDDDGCFLALDGTPQPLEEQFCKGRLYTFGTQQVWTWAHLSDLEIAAGEHTLSVLAHEAGLRVARLYLTQGDELPPIDAEWPEDAIAR